MRARLSFSRAPGTTIPRMEQVTLWSPARRLRFSTPFSRQKQVSLFDCTFHCYLCAYSMRLLGSHTRHPFVLLAAGYIPESSRLPSQGRQIGQEAVITFPAGRGRVIKGVDVAVCAMRRGERARVYIRSDCAFDSSECNPGDGLMREDVPCGTNVIVHLHLLAVHIAKDIWEMNDEEKVCWCVPSSNGCDHSLKPASLRFTPGSWRSQNKSVLPATPLSSWRTIRLPNNTTGKVFECARWSRRQLRQRRTR